jgi:orotate phosphoribosyltransferase
MVEDVVTTGLSSREAIAAVAREGGEVIAEASLVDRSNGTADLGVPFFPLIRLDVPTYKPDQLPPELQAIPAIKPGSRKEAA